MIQLQVKQNISFLLKLSLSLSLSVLEMDYLLSELLCGISNQYAEVLSVRQHSKVVVIPSVISRHCPDMTYIHIQTKTLCVREASEQQNLKHILINLTVIKRLSS